MTTTLVLRTALNDDDHASPAPSLPVRLVASHLWFNLIGTPGDNGDLMHKLLAGMAGVSPDDRARREFARAIVLRGGDSVVRLDNRPGERPYYYSIDSLDVDYHPCMWLRSLAESVGLDPRTRWPMKTTTRLNADYVSLRAGYGRGYNYYYPQPDGDTYAMPCEVGPLMPWIVRASGSVGLPDGAEMAFDWRTWATTIGIDAETGADFEPEVRS